MLTSVWNNRGHSRNDSKKVFSGFVKGTSDEVVSLNMCYNFSDNVELDQETLCINATPLKVK